MSENSENNASSPVPSPSDETRLLPTEELPTAPMPADFFRPGNEGFGIPPAGLGSPPPAAGQPYSQAYPSGQAYPVGQPYSQPYEAGQPQSYPLGQPQPQTYPPGQPPSQPLGRAQAAQPLGPAATALAPRPKGKRVGLIVALALVVIAGGGAVYWFGIRDRPQESPPVTASTTGQPTPGTSATETSPATAPTSGATPTGAATTTAPATTTAAPATTTAPAVTAPAGTVVPMGQDGVAGETTWRVNSATTSTAPISGFHESEQGVFLFVDVTLTYNGSSLLGGVVSRGSVTLTTADGLTYETDSTAMLTQEGALMVHMLGPGESVTGTFIFDVPADAASGAVLNATDVELDGSLSVGLAIN